MPHIRPMDESDEPAIIDLSLRAWEPVFTSLGQVLGARIFERLYPDWRESQAEAVRDVCRSDDDHVWVAEEGGAVAGFVAVRLHDGQDIGEIYMMAVDPNHQRRGIGAELTDLGIDLVREADKTVVMVETGGDPGHASARATYEHAGFTPLPVARYFMAV